MYVSVYVFINCVQMYVKARGLHSIIFLNGFCLLKQHLLLNLVLADSARVTEQQVPRILLSQPLNTPNSWVTEYYTQFLYGCWVIKLGPQHS